MEEELNEHELEERLYAMLHYADETQNNLNEGQQNKSDAIQLVEYGPRSTLCRYWRTGADSNPYQKVNTPKEPVTAVIKNTSTPDSTKPKEEKSTSPNPPPPIDLSIFQSPVPQNIKKTIEIVEHDLHKTIVVESSDEDEVVEVALPPKPTYTIESSDDDELHIIKSVSPSKTDSKSNSEHKSNSGERAVSASPVPSVVSSVSDEFIRSDCIALNISSRRPDKHSFDFSLHGSDLLVQNTPSKKKKKKKNKEAATSTPITAPADKSVNTPDGCFATPKSKAKNKKQKTKTTTQKTIPDPDVYDSDSNQAGDPNITKNTYIVTEKSLPSVDVYESDSNQSEIIKVIDTDQSKKKNVNGDSSDSSVSSDKPTETPKILKKNNIIQNSAVETVDLTENDTFINLDDSSICESIVMANVTGFTDHDSVTDENTNPSPNHDISKYVSSKVPSILNEDLDFDNLKGNDKVCKRRRYSLTTLRAEMEKFYNESWGGEDFNHREIQKNMSRDKSLWAIDPKDRMPSLVQRKVKCNYCNRVGHRDDTCRQRPPVCYMCGNTGHFEPRCPSKICVNCGAPNLMYSTMCRGCSGWAALRCAECGQRGHPASHCPDLWRRYHNTISTDVSLEMCTQQKKPHQQFCSGCSRRGHLVHTCRVSLPFSGLSINSPFVYFYRPIYSATQTNHNKRSKSFSEDSTVTSASTPVRQDRNKRLSKSPTVHETHCNKKRNTWEDAECRNTKSPVNVPKITPAKEAVDNTPKNKNKSGNLDASPSVTTTEKTPDFISIISSNHDNQGHILQDNEVSDTSDAVTSARIYITNDIIKKLKTKEGEDWLKTAMDKFKVTVGNSDVTSFLTIKGKVADQELFQSELREWSQSNKAKNVTNHESNSEQSKNDHLISNLPKNRNNLIRHLSKALDSLKADLGDPRALYRELTYSQDKHEKLLKQKVISPNTLCNSRSHINAMLKKLNIILLGQAGLADGTEHVNELHFLREKLLNSRQKNISPSVRREIGEHYHRIFSPSARDDYSELMNKYYLSNTTARLAKKRKRINSVNPNFKRMNLNENYIIPSDASDEPVVISAQENHKSQNNSGNKAKHLQKLVFYHQRLQQIRPKGAGCKQERLQIMRRLHAFIISLFKKDTLTSKVAKKVKRVGEQAQKFLSEV